MKLSQFQPTFRQTLNNMGGMSIDFDPVTLAFLEAAESCSFPVLDVGAAFGAVTKEALKLGATVTANDLNSEHLKILEAEVEQSLKKRLKSIAGRFPDDLQFSSNSFDAILLARVLHFMTGEQIESGLRDIQKWLRPGGSVFIVGVTPFLKHLKPFLPRYYERLNRDSMWPGFVEDLSIYDPNGASELPRSMNFLCPTQFPKVLEKVGFHITHCETFSRKEHVSHFESDGREALGIIATLPK